MIEGMVLHTIINYQKTIWENKVDYSQLQPENIISENQYEISQDFINKYTESVKDDSVYNNLVPPWIIYTYDDADES